MRRDRDVPNASPITKGAIQPPSGGRFTATNVTLQQPAARRLSAEENQFAGGPAWLATDRFDVAAKADSGDRVRFKRRRGGGPSRGQLMLRALLTERFKIQLHTEARELPIFALIPVRDGALGPQLTRSTHDCTGPDCGLRVFPGTMLAAGTTVAQLAAGLSTLVGRVVRDRTGLTDKFDFTLRWTPDQVPPGYNRKAAAMGLPPVDADGPPIVTAIREQLGLKLEPQKGPVDVLVIDRAEHPTAN